MYEIFSYIPKSYDFVDTTIDKNDKTYRIQFRVCEINEDFIKIECLELSNYLQKIKNSTAKEIAEKIKNGNCKSRQQEIIDKRSAAIFPVIKELLHFYFYVKIILKEYFCVKVKRGKFKVHVLMNKKLF